MFSDDIILQNKKIWVIGKENAVAETWKNFESAESTKISVLSIYKNENTVADELKIIINSNNELFAVDIIARNPK